MWIDGRGQLSLTTSLMGGTRESEDFNYHGRFRYLPTDDSRPCMHCGNAEAGSALYSFSSASHNLRPIPAVPEAAIRRVMMAVNVVNVTNTSVADALAIVSQFFTKEWPSTREEDVRVVRITNGYSSSVHVVHRTTPAVQEPAALLLRQATGYFADKSADIIVLSEVEQALVYHANGQKGWGPKLYGVAPKCRVEKLIPSRPLTSCDLDDPLIIRDLAQSYARFHSLDLPLNRHKIDDYADDLCRTADSLIKNRDTFVTMVKHKTIINSNTLGRACLL